MGRTEFDARRREIMARCPPASDLRGMVIDFDHALTEDTALFERVEVREMDESACQVRAVCGCVPPVPLSDEIADEIERLWMTELRYQAGEEAHTLEVTEDAVTLDAITVTRGRSYYITARIVVELHPCSVITGRQRE